jgi:hypothetical protein
MSASSISILLALTLASPVGGAQPLSLQHRFEAPEAAAASAEDEAPSEGGEAVEAPEPEVDPNAAIVEARDARGQDANAASWEREGDELAAKGERAGAIAAYTEARSRATDDAKVAELDQKIAAAYEQAAGNLPATEVVDGSSDMAASSSEPQNPEVPGAALATDTEDVKVEREPVVNKWYFWVTVVAITASAGAIAGIASKAAIDERKAARAGTLVPPTGAVGQSAPALFRF